MEHTQFHSIDLFHWWKFCNGKWQHCCLVSDLRLSVRVRVVRMTDRRRRFGFERTMTTGPLLCRFCRLVVLSIDRYSSTHVFPILQALECQLWRGETAREASNADSPIDRQTDEGVLSLRRSILLYCFALCLLTCKYESPAIRQNVVTGFDMII